VVVSIPLRAHPSDPAGTPAGEAAVRAALEQATR